MRLLESSEPWFAAAGILLVGVAVAYLVGPLVVRRLTRRVLGSEDRAEQTSLVAFWGVVAIFGVVALTRLLGGAVAEAGLATAVDRLIVRLPDAVVALVVVIVGSVLATAARRAVSRFLADRRPRYAEPLGTLAFAAVLAAAVLLAARQMGVQTVLLDGLLIAAGTAVLLALGLAGGLGGRAYAEALAAGRHAESILTVGDLIEVDGRRGRVLRLGSTSVRLGLAGGAVAEVPNQLLLRATVVVFEHDDAPAEPTERTPSATGESEGPSSRAADGEEASATVVVEVDDEAPTRLFDAPPGAAGARPAEAKGSAREREPTAILDREELERERARLHGGEPEAVDDGGRDGDGSAGGDPAGQGHSEGASGDVPPPPR